MRRPVTRFNKSSCLDPQAHRDDRQSILSRCQPAVNPIRLGQGSGKTIQNKPALAIRPGQSFGDHFVHQVVRDQLAPLHHLVGGNTQSGVVFTVFAQQIAGWKSAESRSAPSAPWPAFPCLPQARPAEAEDPARTPLCRYRLPVPFACCSAKARAALTSSCGRESGRTWARSRHSAA